MSELLQKAVDSFTGGNMFDDMEGYLNIENEYIKEHADELIYCYIHNHGLMEFDTWTRYEELMGEKLTYQEYVAIDANFDLDPHDITPENKETIEGWKAGWKESLKEFRGEQEIMVNIPVYNVMKVLEDENTVRDFLSTGIFLGEEQAKENFEKEFVEEPIFEENGVFNEGKDYVESDYLNEKYSRISIEKSEILFTKAQLREFLNGIDKDVLKEVGYEKSSAVEKDPLMVFIEQEVPYRMEVEHGIPLTEEMKNELIECVQNDVEILIDYDKFDMNLKNMHRDMMKEQIWDYENWICHLCEVLNNKGDHWGVERDTEQFEVFFESDHYLGIYFYNGENEYYLVDKETGAYDLVLGDGPDFVGKYSLEKMDFQKDIHIENAEIFEWFVKYSRENLKGFEEHWPEDKLKGLQNLENVLCDVYLQNSISLLEEVYLGDTDFNEWIDKEVCPQNEDKGIPLYNVLVLLEEWYEGNEGFVSWAENEIGVSKDLMKRIGFLESEEKIKKGSFSLDEKVNQAKEKAVKRKELVTGVEKGSR